MIQTTALVEALAIALVEALAIAPRVEARGIVIMKVMRKR
jgi:hypothetical protein